jgi:hypothetical protein
VVRKIKNKKASLKKRLHYCTKLIFVPHADNQYRPHLTRRYGLLIILIGVVGIQLLYNNITTGRVLGRESEITIGELFDQTNAARVKEEKPTLVLNDSLNKAAYLKAQNMFAEQYWAHTSPDGTPPWKWFSDVGYNYANAGENLAKNFSNSDAVVSAWLSSPSHRDNVLKAEYQDVGFAVVNGELKGQNTLLVVALYGRPATAVQSASTSFSGTDVNVKLSPVVKLGVALQSLTPAALGSVIVLLFAALVAYAAHVYRRKLPKVLQKGWYRHHGLYKAVGLVSIAVIIVALYGGGGWQL